MPAQNQLPRRTLEELIAIHSVERDIHDVIVEGPSDQNIVEWFLLESGKTNCVVYEVGVFQIDARDVLSLGLEDNNRGRVITLADVVAKKGNENLHITCVADRDFDKVLETERDCQFLLITDYACMLMYTFNRRVLSKYLRFKLKGFKKSPDQVIREISEALQTLFAVRLAKHVLHLGLKTVPWQVCCSLEVGGVELDMSEYLRRYLNKNARNHERNRLLNQIEECKRWMKFDPRFQIRGHDFLAILIWYISKHKGFGSFSRQTEEAVENELFLSLEFRDLAAENMFQELLVRVGP